MYQCAQLSETLYVVIRAGSLSHASSGMLSQCVYYDLYGLSPIVIFGECDCQLNRESRRFFRSASQHLKTGKSFGAISKRERKFRPLPSSTEISDKAEARQWPFNVWFKNNVAQIFSQEK